MSDQMALVTRSETLPPARQADSDVTDLLRLAVERDVAVEKLERLVELKVRIEERNARAAFFDALAAFQEECPEIRKTKAADYVTSSGARVHYTYAPLEEITRTIRPVLRRHGFSYSWDVQPGNGVLHITAILRHIAGHEERASFPVPTDSAAKMSAAQKNGAALTYGRRQSLVAVLGLTTADQDVDGTEPGGDTGVLITPEQVADLDALIEEVGANKAAFLRMMGVERLSDIPAAALPMALNSLEMKREQRRRP